LPNIVYDTLRHLVALATLPPDYPIAKPLTAIAVAKARAHTARRELPDGGCRGLYLVVQTSGHRSWALRYRSRGRTVKLTLGPALIGTCAESNTVPQLDTPLSLAAARELATKILREVQAGHDPAAAKRQRREQQHAAEADTLQAVCEEHLRREAGRLRTLASQRRPDLELFYPALGQLPIDQIRRGQFVRVLDHIADERGQHRAGRALGAMKTLLNWHGNRSDYVSVLTRTSWRTAGPAGGRDRVLDDDELRAIWLAAEQDKGPFGPYLRFTLLTATRRGEAAGLRRSEVIDGGRSWLIPASRYKSKRDMLVPLSRAAQAIIAAQPVLAGGDHVFSVDGKYPLGDFASRKVTFDKACGVTGWRIHDARRSARTLLSRAGVNADIAERCLGHAMVGVRRIYDRFEFQSEKAAAFEALAALVERIVRPRSDTVVPIRPRAKPGRRK
jgi:integrase